MTISSSLNAGVSGLAANASRLASISDNIANSSTNGYKRVETNFESLVVSSGAGGSYTAGGVKTTTTRLVDESGSLVTTANSTDIAIRGRGFLPVAKASEVRLDNDSQQMFLARTGSFRTDDEGYLRTDSGQVLLGWPAGPDGTIPPFPRDTADGLQPVQVNVNQFTGEPTTRISLGVNLPSSATESTSTAGSNLSAVEYFDNLGESQNLNIEFTPTVPAAGRSNEWTMTISDSAQPGVTIGTYTLTFNDGLANGGTLASVVRTSTDGTDYNAATGELTVERFGGTMTIDIGRLGEREGLTQQASDFAPLSIAKDGSPVGNMTGVEVNENGFVIANFDTGITRTVYQIPLVDMPNPNGLVAVDGQMYMTSPNSGTFYLWDAAAGPTGNIVGFALEESTTDVAGELTDLITTQRSYTSNAKVIQTVDEMLQETTNIKR